MKKRKSKRDLKKEGFEFTGMYDGKFEIWKSGHDMLLYNPDAEPDEQTIISTFFAEGKTLTRGF